MKKASKLLLLALLIAFCSCQTEPVSEEVALDETSLEEIEAALEDEILISDGEEDLTLEFDSESEILVTNFSSTGKNSSEKGFSCIPDIEGLALNLPDVVKARTNKKPGIDSYFSLEILDSNLSGVDIPAWCVDQDLSLGVEGPFDFDVYSSYEELPEGKFEHPENFDLVNWVLNQSFIGQASPKGGIYAFGHIQWAIWDLVDDSVCQDCLYLTDPTGEWKSNPDNIRLAQEIAQKARDYGQDFIPQCGQQIGVILIPDGKQSIIITKEVQPKEEECVTCKESVKDLTLKFDWCKSKRIKIYQKIENTCRGIKIFDKKLESGEEFTINGANRDGSFGKYIYIFIGKWYYTKIKTNCDIKIGPGYTRGVFEVIEGHSIDDSELCEYVKPEYNKCYRHWGCKHYVKCKYKKY